MKEKSGDGTGIAGAHRSAERSRSRCLGLAGGKWQSVVAGARGSRPYRDVGPGDHLGAGTEAVCRREWRVELTSGDAALGLAASEKVLMRPSRLCCLVKVGLAVSPVLAATHPA
jgi:hypothetical protein